MMTKKNVRPIKIEPEPRPKAWLIYRYQPSQIYAVKKDRQEARDDQKN